MLVPKRFYVSCPISAVYYGTHLKRNLHLEKLIKICKFWLNYVNSDLNAAKTELI